MPSLIFRFSRVPLWEVGKTEVNVMSHLMSSLQPDAATGAPLPSMPIGAQTDRSDPMKIVEAVMRCLNSALCDQIRTALAEEGAGKAAENNSWGHAPAR
jgi:hypothetical protein